MNAPKILFLSVAVFALTLVVTMIGCAEKGVNPPPATHTLTTNANPAAGGKVSVNGTASTGTTTHNAGTQVTVTATPNTGYKFTGWSGASTSTNASVTVTVNSNLTLIANFQQQQLQTTVYTLTTSIIPSSSAGTVSPASGSYDAETQISLTATPKSGYEFSYWTGSMSGPTNPITVIMGSNMSIAAVFTPIGEPPPPIATYAVTFNSNGGSSVATQTVTQGGYVAQPANPTRAGYTFDGWYSNIGLTMAWDFDENTVSANATLYAKWTESQVTPPTTTYTVTFNSNGGSSVPTQTVTEGGYAAQPANPTRSGYTFGGWYSNTGLTAAWDFSVNTVNTNTTLYARWTNTQGATTYTVSFNAGGGSPTPSPITVDSGASITLPAAPTRAGYSFGGWGSASSPMVVTRNITLTAKWAKHLTVSFDPDGGTPVFISPVIVDSGSTLGAEFPDNPTRTNFIFGGWVSGSTQITANTVITQSVVLDAKWIWVPGIQFNPNINYSSFTDPRDGKIYKSVKIGNQTWMAENLNYATSSSRCYGADTSYCATYGRLYTWSARGACPTGWHLPSKAEWDTLLLFVGDGNSVSNVSSTKLKSTSGWYSIPQNLPDGYKYSLFPGTDDYGFSALPGGIHSDTYYSIGHMGYWWTGTESSSDRYVYIRTMAYIVDIVGELSYSKTTNALSVRCVQDK